MRARQTPFFPRTPRAGGWHTSSSPAPQSICPEETTSATPAMVAARKPWAQPGHVTLSKLRLQLFPSHLRTEKSSFFLEKQKQKEKKEKHNLRQPTIKKSSPTGSSYILFLCRILYLAVNEFENRSPTQVGFGLLHIQTWYDIRKTRTALYCTLKISRPYHLSNKIGGLNIIL